MVIRMVMHLGYEQHTNFIEKQRFPQLVKKFLILYGTGRFIIVFTGDHHLSLS